MFNSFTPEPTLPPSPLERTEEKSRDVVYGLTLVSVS